MPQILYFCEWAYVLDFDQNKFEVYKGFNEELLESHERFYDFQTKLLEKERNKYLPVKLKAIYDFSNLPSEEDFCKETDPESED